MQIRKCETKIAATLNQFDSSKDYYSILEADRGASQREIERLYRRLARKRHPDRGGTEEDMKALNEAYRVLHDEASRKQYDSFLRQPQSARSIHHAGAPAREVGVYGQALSAFLCIVMGLMLLLLVRFNGLWFLWPLAILAIAVSLFGVLIAHSALTNARALLPRSHPARRFRLLQELFFWGMVSAAAVGVYEVLTALQ